MDQKLNNKKLHTIFQIWKAQPYKSDLKKQRNEAADKYHQEIMARKVFKEMAVYVCERKLKNI